MISEVEQGKLYRGSLFIESFSMIREIERLGIKNVINLQNHGDEDEETWLEARKIQFFDFDLPGLWPPSDEEVKNIIGIFPHLSGPTYVHCRHGRERTGLIVGAYRILIQKWPKKAAIKEMEKMGSRWPYFCFASRLLREL